MAVPPKFAAHRLVLGADAAAAAASAAPLHTVELYLDYVCPFSAKLFKTVYDGVIPQLRAGGAKTAATPPVQLVFRHQVQPWHPSSTLVHEAALYVQRAAAAAGRPELFWAFSSALFADQKAYMDVHVVAEGRNATYKRLGALAASATGGAVAADDLYAALAIPSTPAADGSVNVGNRVTDDLKVVVKMARLVGVHVSPTVIVDGVVNNAVSSSWTPEQWLEFLGKL